MLKKLLQKWLGIKDNESKVQEHHISIALQDEKIGALIEALKRLDKEMSSYAFEKRPGQAQMVSLKLLTDKMYEDIEEIRSQVDKLVLPETIFEQLKDLKASLVAELATIAEEGKGE